MQHSITRTLLSAAAAAALCCSLSINTVQALAEELAPPAVSYDDSELGDFIVRLAGDAVLAAPEASGQGADYIDTDAAQSAEDSLRSAQDRVAKHIRRLYPEFEIKRRFTLTANGFSCRLPESIIPDIKADPLVEEVSPVRTDFMSEPQLATARELGGITDFCNNTDCTGEGEVIAVIDTEFDVTHDMFAAMEGKEARITKDDVFAISRKAGFSSKLSSDKVYLSNKVPFAYDYSDDTPYTLNDNSRYHGTHVSGIAAGNRFTTSDGKEISGVAPDAQLLMMKVYGFSGSTSAISVSDEAIAAAIEDAVKLKADVINMSFGRVYEYYDSLFYADAIAAAENAGVTLCASAGNNANDRLGRGRLISTEDIDTGNISEPSIFPQVLSVASADNTVSVTTQLIAGELTLGYCECGGKYCYEKLNKMNYPLVFIDSYDLFQLTASKVSGKIVAFSGSSEQYPYLDETCSNYGAAGLIIADDSTADKFEDYLYTTELPLAAVTEADFARLRESGAETATFTSETAPDKHSGTISGFSSYGVGTNLDLKPEIMGIGGNVLSANYNNTLSRMSGTSMASPYVTGCVALCDQMLKKQGVELTGAERPQRIKNILMNSAVPYSDDGVIISPRRQGAGLAALDKAANDKVIMTGSSGKADIELRDGVGDSFSFELNISNISDEDVTFPYSDISLITDGYYCDKSSRKNYISGQTFLPSENDLGSDITVPAGKTVTKTITVELDSEQTAELDKVFTNGFFVEGYVTLHGAANCCDISVPLLGFRGDWCSVPVLDLDRFPLLPKATIGVNELRTDISFAKATAMIRDIVADDLYLLSLDPDCPEDFPKTAEFMFNDQQKEEFLNLRDGVSYFSPNQNVFGDYFGCYYVPVREAVFSDLELYDAEGKLLYDSPKEQLNSFKTQLALLPYETYDLPDGRYTSKLNAYIEYGAGKEKTQTYPLELAIDREAPEVEYEIIEKDGRKLLELTATDTALDGVFIMGLKAEEESSESKASFNALAIAQRTLSYDPFLDSAYLETDQRIFSGYLHADTDSLSDIQTVLTGLVKPKNYYNYCDIIPAVLDKNGVFSLMYDVTDFSEYSVCVLDRALNEFDIETGSNIPEEFKTGIWKLTTPYNEEYYEFRGDGTLTLKDIHDRCEYNGKYVLDGERFAYSVNENSKTETIIKWTDSEHAVLQYKDSALTGTLTFISSNELSNFEFYTDPELMQLARLYYYFEHGVMPTWVNVDYSIADSSVSLSVMLTTESEGEKVLDVYTVSRESAEGVDITGEYVWLVSASRFETGCVWSSYTPTNDYGMVRAFVFNNVTVEEGSGVFAYQADGIEQEFDCQFKGDMVMFSFNSYDDTSEPVRSARIKFYSPDNITLEWDNGFEEMFYCHRDITSISELGYMTNDKIAELSRELYIKTTDIVPDDVRVRYNGVEEMVAVDIIVKDANGIEQVVDEYRINVVHGTGFTPDGKPVNIVLGYYGTPMFGDVNADKKVDAKDASLILVHYAQISTGSDGCLDYNQSEVANINLDDMIDANDASLILEYYSFVSSGGDVDDMNDFLRMKNMNTFDNYYGKEAYSCKA